MKRRKRAPVWLRFALVVPIALAGPALCAARRRRCLVRWRRRVPPRIGRRRVALMPAVLVHGRLLCRRHASLHCARARRWRRLALRCPSLLRDRREVALCQRRSVGVRARRVRWRVRRPLLRHPRVELLVDRPRLARWHRRGTTLLHVVQHRRQRRRELWSRLERRLHRAHLHVRQRTHLHRRAVHGALVWQHRLLLVV